MLENLTTFTAAIFDSVRNERPDKTRRTSPTRCAVGIVLVDPIRDKELLSDFAVSESV